MTETQKNLLVTRRTRFTRITYFIIAGSLVWIVAFMFLIIFRVGLNAGKDPVPWLISSYGIMVAQFLPSGIILTNYSFIIRSKMDSESSSGKMDSTSKSPSSSPTLHMKRIEPKEYSEEEKRKSEETNQPNQDSTVGIEPAQDKASSKEDASDNNTADNS